MISIISYRFDNGKKRSYKINTTSKMKMKSKTLPEKLLMTPRLDRHSYTVAKPEMLSAV